MDKLSATIKALNEWLGSDDPFDTRINVCIVADARDLLREKQPRVLTYKEAKKIKTGTDIWVEIKNSNWTCIAFTFTSVTQGHVYKWFNFYGSQNRQFIQAMRYGSSIRFWTGRPTREQMQNTPWKVSNQESEDCANREKRKDGSCPVIQTSSSADPENGGGQK